MLGYSVPAPGGESRRPHEREQLVRREDARRVGRDRRAESGRAGVIRQPVSVVQQLPDRDRPIDVRARRQPTVDRIVQAKNAFVHQLQNHRAGHRLGDARDDDQVIVTQPFVTRISRGTAPLRAVGQDHRGTDTAMPRLRRPRVNGVTQCPRHVGRHFRRCGRRRLRGRARTLDHRQYGDQQYDDTSKCHVPSVSNLCLICGLRLRNDTPPAASTPAT